MFRTLRLYRTGLIASLALSTSLVAACAADLKVSDVIQAVTEIDDLLIGDQIQFTDGSGPTLENPSGDLIDLTGRLAVDSGTAATISTIGTNNLWFGTPPASVTTAANNVAIGHGALALNTTAAHTVAIGTNAFANLTGNTLSDSVAVGINAGQYQTTAGDNTFVGYRAGQNTTTGNSNTIIGSEAYVANTTGGGNIGVGQATLTANTTGNNNIAVGTTSLSGVTTGSQNIGIGPTAGQGITTGINNIAIGFEPMKSGSCVSATCDNNIAVGQAVLNLVVGSSNIGIGGAVMPLTTTANFNTAVGTSALNANTTGGSNVAIGKLALDTLTTGILNTGIGVGAGNGITTGDANTVIGSCGSFAASTSGAVVFCDGVGNKVFYSYASAPSANHGSVAGSSSRGTITSVGSFSSVTITFPAAYPNGSRCHIQSHGGPQLYSTTQSASAPVVSCYDIAGNAANCNDFSFDCNGY